MKKNLIAGLKWIRWFLPLLILAEAVSILGCCLVAEGLGGQTDGQFPFVLLGRRHGPPVHGPGMSFGFYLLYLAGCFLTYAVAGRLALKNRVTHHGLHIWALGLGSLPVLPFLWCLYTLTLHHFTGLESDFLAGMSYFALMTYLGLIPVYLLAFAPAQLVKLAGVALGAWWPRLVARKSVPGWGQKTCDLSKRDLTDLQLVEKLKGLPNLKILKLAGNPVTDAATAYLVELPNLKWLDLRDTRITDAGVKDLQKTLPNCKVRR